MICLGGCSLTPKYTRPAAPVPAAWPSGPAYKEPPATGQAPLAAERAMAAILHRPAPAEDHRHGPEQQPRSRVAALNVEKARAMYRIQRAELLPRLETGVTASKQHVMISGNTGLVTLQQFGVNLGLTSWELDFFGRIRSLKDKALEEYFATEQARQQRPDPPGVRSCQRLPDPGLGPGKPQAGPIHPGEPAGRLQRHSPGAVEVGFAPELDLRQVQTRVDSARVDVARYTAQVAQDENALNLLAGSPVPADLTPQALSVIKPLPDVSAGMSSDVLLRRPDILQAENLLKAPMPISARPGRPSSPALPSPPPSARPAGSLPAFLVRLRSVWNYAPQVVLPIFDARTWSALKVTKVDRDIAVAQYEKAIQGAFREVADALAQRGTLGDQLAAQQSLVEASAKTYRLSNARYEKGIDIYLNVLDAQRSLYGAQQGLIAIRLARLANQVKLYAVLGGGAEAGAPAGGG